MPRDLGTIPPAMLEDSSLVWFVFCRLIFTALPPIGILFTDYADGETDGLVLDVDGAGPVRWDTTIPFDLGEIATSLATIQDISTLTLANGNDYWSDLVNQYGIAAMPFELYVGFFDPTVNPPTFVGAVPMWIGVTERASYGNSASMTVYLVPNAVPFTRKFPRGRFTASEGYNFLPPSPLIIKWGTINVIVGGVPAGRWGDTSLDPVVPPPDLGGGQMPIVQGPPPPPPTTVGFY